MQKKLLRVLNWQLPKLQFLFSCSCSSFHKKNFVPWKLSHNGKYCDIHGVHPKRTNYLSVCCVLETKMDWNKLQLLIASNFLMQQSTHTLYIIRCEHVILRSVVSSRVWMSTKICQLQSLCSPATVQSICSLQWISKCWCYLLTGLLAKKLLYKCSCLCVLPTKCISGGCCSLHFSPSDTAYIVNGKFFVV